MAHGQKVMLFYAHSFTKAPILKSKQYAEQTAQTK